MSAAPLKTFRGEMVDVGGRRLRVVTAGPAGERPTIVLEHGAFGCAADWAVVQEKLAAKGLRSIAYDRAGLGHSDPGPRPRDGRAIVDDLTALLRDLNAARAVTLVLATHDLNLAASVCSRLVLLRQGRVLAQGPTAEVLTPANVQALYDVDADVTFHPGAGHLMVTPLRRHGAQA